MLQETYSEEALKIIKNIGNDCSTRFKNIQISLIKPAAKCIAPPLARIIKYSTFETNICKEMENVPYKK